jgi:GPH family glycoside/pentoside/hexuronide:cation symporter
MMSAGAMPTRQMLAYGALGFPLAFAALPLYVHVPKLYADSVGLPLALVGAVLLLTRFADALIDPLLGQWSDRRGNRRQLILHSPCRCSASASRRCWRRPPTAKWVASPGWY